MNSSLFSAKQFAHNLVTWYRSSHRDMPWRLTKDPYCIMVSEFMLQQTQVATVIPYYIRFVQRFPNLQSLASAAPEEVLSYWAGLGYYSRVRNLQAACQQIVMHHGGIFPRDYPSIRQLKGVGDYTVGAILSIAFEQATPAVDGNVMRVFSRMMSDPRDIALEKTKQYWRTSLVEWVDHENPSEYTQGLMELGATICTPKKPQCEFCPVRSMCAAYLTKTVDQFPVKLNHIKVKEEFFIAYWIQQGDRILIEQRPDRGLLASQWQLPMKMIEESESRILAQTLPTYRHQFSHRLWTIHLQTMDEGQPNNPTMSQWVLINDLSKKLITAHQRLMALK